MEVIIDEPTNPNGWTTYQTVGSHLSVKSSGSAANIGQSKMKKKVGVLGIGSIGNRHLNNFIELGCAVRGYDPANSPEESFIRQEVIDWADAIVIATPTIQHADDIFDCYNAIKPCLVEKPIADRIIGEALHKSVYMVGYNLRFHSCVKRAREWLGAGAIGKPLWARFTCAQFNNNPSYLRDGVILNWSHEIDLALHLLGGARLACSHAMALEGSGEHLADIILRHDNSSCQTSIHLDYLTRWERRGFVIVGDRGSIECDLVTRQIFHRDNTGRFVDTFYGRDSFDGNYLAEARAFLDRLDGKPAYGCTAKEALEVVKICLEAKNANGGNSSGSNGKHSLSGEGAYPTGPTPGIEMGL
jgi:predicted dehydrogenase